MCVTPFGPPAPLFLLTNTGSAPVVVGDKMMEELQSTPERSAVGDDWQTNRA